MFMLPGPQILSEFQYDRNVAKSGNSAKAAQIHRHRRGLRKSGKQLREQRLINATSIASWHSLLLFHFTGSRAPSLMQSCEAPALSPGLKPRPRETHTKRRGACYLFVPGPRCTVRRTAAGYHGMDLRIVSGHVSRDARLRQKSPRSLTRRASGRKKPVPREVL